MRKVSKKQQAKNAELARIKKDLAENGKCAICGRAGYQLAHLLPKSIYPEYYTKPENLVLMCNDCHKKHDDDVEFRSRQIKLFNRVRSFDELAANKYYRR